MNACNSRIIKPERFYDIEFRDLDIFTPYLVLPLWALSYYHILQIISNHSWYMHILFVILSLLVLMLYLLIITFSIVPTQKLRSPAYTVYRRVTTKRPDGESINNTDITSEYEANSVMLTEAQSLGVMELTIEDANDSAIAKIESTHNAVKGVVESYMFESAFIGALSFGGFLTILTSHSLEREGDMFRSFASDTWYLVNAIAAGHTSIISSCIYDLSSQENLYLLLLILTLLCSMFYLITLTSKLRFMQLSEKLDYLIHSLNRFNQKENDIAILILDKHDAHELVARRATLTSKIAQLLEDASVIEEKILPLKRVIVLFRNLGLTMFYMVVFISGVYFSYVLVILLMSIAGLAYLWGFLEVRRGLIRVRKALIRH